MARRSQQTISLSVHTVSCGKSTEFDRSDGSTKSQAVVGGLQVLQNLLMSFVEYFMEKKKHLINFF